MVIITGSSEGNVPVKMRTRRVVSPELCPAQGFPGGMGLSSALVAFKFWSWGWETMHS